MEKRNQTITFEQDEGIAELGGQTVTDIEAIIDPVTNTCHYEGFCNGRYVGFDFDTGTWREI